MAARKTPEAWYWSYDIKPEDLDSVLTPGTRLMRLSSYRKGTAKRYAALVYQDAGPERRHLLDLDAAELATRLAETPARPVAITVDTGEARPRFSLVVQTGPGALSSVHLDLDEAGVRALLDDQHCIADLATYAVDGQRRYAVVLEERTGPVWLFTGVTAHQLDAALVEHGATLVRLRSYVDAGRPLFAAVAERLDGGWAWYADLDADAVARNLEGNAAYPVDLDATRDERGVRFAVIMYRDRER